MLAPPALVCLLPADAVGMGLNLAIRRIIFTSLSKYDGTAERALTTAEIKQVAGRAGRYGSRFPDGIATATTPEDLERLAAALQQPSEELASAYLLPSLAQLEMLHGQHPAVRRGTEWGTVGGRAGKPMWCTASPAVPAGARRSPSPCPPMPAAPVLQDKLPAILRRFEEAAQGSLARTQYRYARYEEQYTLATMLRHLPLSLREAWAFSISPADPDDAPVASALLTFATVYAHRGRVSPAAILHGPVHEARSEMELQQVCGWRRAGVCVLLIQAPDPGLPPSCQLAH